MEEKEQKKETLVIASGYFDPLHQGHIQYLENSKKLGDALIVIVNTDAQAILKKGYCFMPCDARLRIVEALKCVDEVVKSVDTGSSVKDTIRLIHNNLFLNKGWKKLVYAVGGDHIKEELLEFPTCQELGVEIADRVSQTLNSSSKIVREARENKIEDK